MARTLFTMALTKISMSQAGMTGPNDYSVTDIRKLQRDLKNLNPKLRTQLVRDAKKAGEPVQLAVKSAIRGITPLSGLTQGRLNFNNSIDAKGKSHKPDDVKLQFGTRSTGKSQVTSLVSVRVLSPAVVMMDMAGKSGRSMGRGYKGSGMTREYPYKGGTRKHRVDGGGIKKPNRNYKFPTQGQALVSNLGSQASRYAWPNALEKIPVVRKEIEAILEKAYADINRKGL